MSVVDMSENDISSDESGGGGAAAVLGECTCDAICMHTGLSPVEAGPFILRIVMY